VALGLAHLEREVVRVALHEELGDIARERAHVREGHAPAQRRPDVDALRAGHLGERLKPELAQQVAGLPGRPSHRAEVGARGGVEVEDDPVGLAHPVGARQPHVRRDRVLADEVDERLGLAHERVHDGPAALVDLNSPDPVRVVVGNVLLEEPLAVDPVGEAHEAERPVAHVRQHPLRDVLVVVGQVRLRDPVLGEELLVGVGDLDGHDGRSRTTSRAALSSRSPR
jgi:hypothetical protein